MKAVILALSLLAVTGCSGIQERGDYQYSRSPDGACVIVISGSRATHNTDLNIDGLSCSVNVITKNTTSENVTKAVSKIIDKLPGVTIQ